MAIVLSMIWGCPDSGQHKSCRHSIWALLLHPSISQKLGIFLCHQLSPLEAPLSGSYPSLQSLKIHLSHRELDSVWSILVSPSDGWEREKTTPYIYCTAFLLVLAGPLWPHVPWKNTSTHPCIIPLSFRTLWGNKTISSPWLERRKPETVCCRFPSVFIPHARGRLWGWQPPLCFFHNNCSLQIAHEICAESLCCPRTWPKPSSGLPRFSNSHDSQSRW